MFDTMTLTKAAGALCGSLLVFMLGGWVAQEIYGSDAHGDGHDQAYVIEVEEEEPAAEEEEEVDFASLYAAADASKGERVFNKCSACHQLEAGANGVGPHLYDAVGREVGSVDGFNYSGALGEVVEVWSPEELDAFLENPRTYAPGTSMGFAGLNKVEDRVNVIAYIDEQDGEMTAVEGAADEADAPAEEASDEGAEDENTEEAAAESGTGESADSAAEDDTSGASDDTDTAASTEDDAESTDMAQAETSGSEETSGTEEAADADASEEATEAAAADEGSDFAALVAAADVSDGERVFNQCRACHVLEAGTNRVGPYLHGVVDRDIAAADGFRYSDALESLDGQWTYDELSAFLENPREYAAGNRMSYGGLSDEEDRAAVIAYIEAESQ